ncbi:DEAD/DEAH box helicase [Tabrizicola sp.]|uniref:DEAD/DEAH box helicase n=1 Tax=Tabrizicola sp. TaxID=2005166 RepID=UPI00286A1CF4|nr:DEAD/DEAH box helicase [Tabrizicola sp.]
MDDVRLAAPMAQALAAKGYETLTAVQLAMLTEEVAGRDLLVSAQTGSGKTVAFGLAMAPELLAGNDRLLYADVPGALIIAPTRELALQVARELDWLYAEAGAKIATCVGGMDYRTEKRALERGAHIVVGTPGRLRDHIERRSLDLSGLRAAVLDEADEMLDLGFREDLEFILQAAPQDRRTLMFSATVSKDIAALAAEFQRDALRIMAQGEAKQHVDIEYRALSVAARDRENAIFNALRFYEAQTALVFCKTRANVNNLMARMGNRGFQVVALSGELSQQERTHALQALRDGRARVCVATDVAARGIDLPGLELVIHADLPSNSETLLHRSGRTGRAGQKGVSALIVVPAEFKKAQRLLQGAKVVAEWGSAPSAEDVTAKDDMRMLKHPALMAGVGDDGAMVEQLLAQFGPEAVAAGFVRMWREGRSAPEVLSDQATPAAAAAPRERGEFGASVWFSLTVGRSGRAEARWLLPKICDAGGISKDGIGAIRVQEDVTYVQIGAALADKFGPMLELDKGVIMERMAGEPSLDRPERAPYAARPERSERPARTERPERTEARPERREKPAYAPKPARVVEEGDNAPAAEPRKTYVKRDDAEKAPYAPREAKPYVKRDDAGAKPYAPREAASAKPYAPRAAAGAPKPYAKRDDAGAKPYAPRDAKPYAAKPFAAKPYAPRDAAKPYVKRDDADADRKPRWSPEDKAAPKSAGYKSLGGAAGKPARATGYKSHSSDGAGYKPKAEGEGDAKRTYAPTGDGARPFVKRDGPAGGKAGGFKSHAADGKKPFARVKPAAPKVDAKDTSKRFVPPKGPKR